MVHGYYMQSGNMAAVLVTAGAGISNALTEVVGSWAIATRFTLRAKSRPNSSPTIILLE